MAAADSSVRQSVAPARSPCQARPRLGGEQKTTASRVLEDLIETGLQAKVTQRKRFFELTDRLSEASDPAGRQRLQEKLARMTFAE